MPAADFIHAVGQLLRDGTLRDTFATEPLAVASKLGLNDADREALLQLDGAEIERQALVLLRKRFSRVRDFLPITCSRLAENAWSEFIGYSRDRWPENGFPPEKEAHEFCLYLKAKSPVSDIEFNRLDFCLSQRRLSLSIARELPTGRARTPILQILIRTGSGILREFQFFLQL